MLGRGGAVGEGSWGSIVPGLPTWDIEAGGTDVMERELAGWEIDLLAVWPVLSSNCCANLDKYNNRLGKGCLFLSIPLI